MSRSQRTISILGATGSIGTQTLDVLSNLGNAYSLRWVTCNTKWENLLAVVAKHRPYGVAIRDEDAYQAFIENSSFTGPVLCGEKGLEEAAADAENDVVMSAMVGFSGVVPTIAAIRAGHIVALANKETLVSAGEIIMNEVAKTGAKVIAVDSEHSAILQSIVGERRTDVHKMIITASGGPFRSTPADKLYGMTAKDALKHPNWTMGQKITIDSSTMMNKGFEVIEARWLFDIPASNIEVVVHPESVIHSLVEFVDGSVKAQLGVPTMTVPIQYALTYPNREPLAGPRLDLAAYGSLNFEQPDTDRFPCLRLAYETLQVGGSAGCVLNAANEIAVYAFLAGRIQFGRIPEIISATLSHIEHVARPSLDNISVIDKESRSFATSILAH